MPISGYYAGNGKKVMANMKREYGDKKGEQVFYATANKAKPKAKFTSRSSSGGNASETRRKRAERRARKKHHIETTPMYLVRDRGWNQA